MPRHLRTVSFYFLSVAVLVAALAAGRAIAGEPGAAPDTYDMTAANWLMMLPLVLVLAAAFGMNFRERRLIIRHRVTVANPDLDHSNRRYPRAASAPLSAILPPPALATSIPMLDGLVPADISETRRTYRRALRWVTNLFGSLRVFTYVPTILTLIASADSSQYSLLTWGAWVMANASMTASIYEQNGHKLDHLVLVNACNTLMCLVTMAVISLYQ